MKLKETLRRIWRSFEAFAEAADFDLLTDIASRIERLERAVAELRNPTETPPEGGQARDARAEGQRDDTRPLTSADTFAATIIGKLNS